jgi:hypothetical protein
MDVHRLLFCFLGSTPGGSNKCNISGSSSGSGDRVCVGIVCTRGAKKWPSLCLDSLILALFLIYRMAKRRTGAGFATGARCRYDAGQAALAASTPLALIGCQCWMKVRGDDVEIRCIHTSDCRNVVPSGQAFLRSTQVTAHCHNVPAR